MPKCSGQNVFDRFISFLLWYYAAITEIRLYYGAAKFRIFSSTLPEQWKIPLLYEGRA